MRYRIYIECTLILTSFVRHWMLLRFLCILNQVITHLIIRVFIVVWMKCVWMTGDIFYCQIRCIISRKSY